MLSQLQHAYCDAHERGEVEIDVTFDPFSISYAEGYQVDVKLTGRVHGRTVSEVSLVLEEGRRSRRRGNISSCRQNY